MSNQRLEQLKALLQQSPDDDFLKFALAKEYEKLGRVEEALHFYLHLREHSPDYIGTYYHLGKLYEKVGEPGNAWKTYSKGMQVAQRIGDQHALSELAGARLMMGDEEDFE